MSFRRVYQYSNSVQAHSAAYFWGTDYSGIIKAFDIKGIFLLVWENRGVCIRNILGCQVCIIAIALKKTGLLYSKKPLSHCSVDGYGKDGVHIPLTASNNNSMNMHMGIRRQKGKAEQWGRIRRPALHLRRPQLSEVSVVEFVLAKGKWIKSNWDARCLNI